MPHSPALTAGTRFTTMRQNAACGPIGTRRPCWLRGTPPGWGGLPASVPDLPPGPTVAQTFLLSPGTPGHLGLRDLAGENVTPAR